MKMVNHLKHQRRNLPVMMSLLPQNWKSKLIKLWMKKQRLLLKRLLMQIQRNRSKLNLKRNLKPNLRRSPKPNLRRKLKPNLRRKPK